MAKMSKIKTYYTVEFISRDDETGDDVFNMSLRWENPKDVEDVINNLNKWLTAIDSGLVVSKKN